MSGRALVPFEEEPEAHGGASNETIPERQGESRRARVMPCAAGCESFPIRVADSGFPPKPT